MQDNFASSRKAKLVKSFAFIAKIFCFGFLVFHFTVLLFHNLPDNPISHQFKYEIKGYVDPLFSQSWHLFSPNPANSNNRILVKFTKYQDQQVDTTTWYDISKPLIDQKNASFWSPVQRILKNFSTATISLAKAQSQALEYIEKTDSLKTDSIAADRFYKSMVHGSNGHKAIVHYAYYILKRENDVAKMDSAILDYKVIFSEFPRFSKRDLDYFDLENYTTSVLQESNIRIR